MKLPVAWQNPTAVTVVFYQQETHLYCVETSIDKTSMGGLLQLIHEQRANPPDLSIPLSFSVYDTAALEQGDESVLFEGQIAASVLAQTAPATGSH